MQRLLVSVTVLMLVVACSDEAPERPMVQVVVDKVVLEPFQPKREYVGRLQARDDVSIQAMVAGYVVSRDFREGEVVEEGDVLYTLDASEYDAALSRAKAELASAQASQANALRNFKRGSDLLPRGAISQSEMDDLTANKLEADARIESAWAQVKSAEVDLGYTRIIAPITGRIGRSVASVGDLVGPTTGTLTTLVSIDPIEALFTVSEAAYVAAMKHRMDYTSDIQALRDVEVTLELTTGMTYPEVGYIDYFANRVDEQTGTLEARAAIPNPHSLLVPGQYVKVILQDTNLLEGLFIPQAAVQADQQGNFVLVVDDNGMVQRRNVELDRRIDFKVLVNSGVEEGEQVIVRGLQQVRPGMPVVAQPMPEAEGQG
jgi:membrane fusion protein (multidrug efflux system)